MRVTKKDATAKPPDAVADEPARPVRRRMPRERQSLTHKFSVGGHEGYITAGEYDDGTLGEIFLTDIGKEGSTIKGMMNAFATAISIGLQYGVPLETLVRKFAYVRFEPEGYTGNPEIPFAKSMPDYIMRWLASRYCDADLQEELGHPDARGAGAEGVAGGADARAIRRARSRIGRVASEEPPANGEAATERRRRAGTKSARPTGAAADARSISADGRAAGDPGEAAGPGPGPGVRPVRRDDAADGLVLHVLELREQHRLRVVGVRAAPAYRVPRDQFRIVTVSSWPDALAGPCAPGAPP